MVLASLAAVTAFAVLGKVLSPQFVIWILPLGALAFAWRMHALAAAVAAAAVLTQLEFPSRYFDLVAPRAACRWRSWRCETRPCSAWSPWLSGQLQLRAQEQLLDRGRAALAVRLD